MVTRMGTLVMGLVCVFVVISGCQYSVSVGDGEPGNGSTGLGDGESSDVIVVGVENNTDKPVAGALREAVVWWNENQHEYDAAWKAEFVVRPDAEDPDIVARVEEGDIDCTDGVPSCAPIYDSEHEIHLSDADMEFTLEEIPNREGLVMSAKHELGHVRGVEHCEPPHWLMGCPENATHEQKDYETREFAWRSLRNLSVFVDSDDPAVREDVRAVLDDYEASSDTPDDLQFRFVDHPWLAHIALSIDHCSGCDYRSTEHSVRGGQAYGADDDLEFIYWADVDVTAPENRTQRAVREALRIVITPNGGPAGSDS